MAAALGLAVAGFGHLEHMLKHAIFALERDQLSGAITQHDFHEWLVRMDGVAADSLGTLIERLDHDLRRLGRDDGDLIQTLEKVKSGRNLLCHAQWQPGPDGWQPQFSNTRGEVYAGTLDADDLRAILAMTLDTAQRIARLMDNVAGASGLMASD